MRANRRWTWIERKWHNRDPITAPLWFLFFTSCFVIVIVVFIRTFQLIGQ